MAAQLKSIVTFVAIPTGGTAILPHGLKDSNGRGLVPDSLIASIAGAATLSADNVNVTCVNTSPVTLNMSVLCESWHSFERAFGNQATLALSPQPFVGAQSPALANLVSSIAYGTGQDGIAVFDGVNTFSFASLSGSTYTMNKDTFLAGGTLVAPGITVITAGFRVFVNGLFTNNGIIHNDGRAGKPNGTAGGTSPIGTLGVGTAGGAGHAGVSAGSNGTNQTAANTLGDASPAGGAGGAGGAQGGGLGGTYASSTTNGGSNFLIPIETGFLFTQTASGVTASINPIGGGAGGGGGGSDNAGVIGGGGGGGGGVLIWHAAVFINNGIVRAAGGAGGDASGAGGNGGGGGGGGGGIIMSLSSVRSGSGTYTCPGGAGGAAVGGSGVAGSPGAAGATNVFTAAA